MADEADFITNYMKNFMLDQLDDHDWIRQMKLKCEAYIKNNGTKTTTVDEVVEFLAEDAVKSFPLDVRSICEDEYRNVIDSLFNK
jgi:hypothetical protein